jgi:tetratricopeptide (TPR) repeat protein
VAESYALAQHGVVLAESGQLDEAERALAEAIRLARKLGNTRSVGSWQRVRAGIALSRGDHAQAGQLFQESLAVHSSLDDLWGVTSARANLTHLALEAGELERARALLAENLAIDRESDEQPRVASDLELSARLAAQRGRLASAIRLYARAALLRESVGTQWMEVGWPDPAPEITQLQLMAGEQVFEDGWARGRAMTLLDAIDLAIEEVGEPESSRSAVRK